MKKLLLLIIASLFLTSCSGIAINPNSDKLLAQSAGQLLGYKFAERNPTLTGPAVAIATTLIQGTVSEEQVAQVVALASAQFKSDPILALEISNLLLIIQITPSTGTTTLYNIELVNAAATGFIQGVNLYQSTIASGEKPYQLH